MPVHPCPGCQRMSLHTWRAEQGRTGQQPRGTAAVGRLPPIWPSLSASRTSSDASGSCGRRSTTTHPLHVAGDQGVAAAAESHRKRGQSSAKISLFALPMQSYAGATYLESQQADLGTIPMRDHHCQAKLLRHPIGADIQLSAGQWLGATHEQRQPDSPPPAVRHSKPPLPHSAAVSLRRAARPAAEGRCPQTRLQLCPRPSAHCCRCCCCCLGHAMAAPVARSDIVNL